MTTLTDEERSTLRAIANDRFSAGAFSGMIYNAVKDCDIISEETIDEHIKLALQIRLRITELTK